MMLGNVSGYRSTTITNKQNWRDVSAAIPDFVSLNEIKGLALDTADRSSRTRRAAVDNRAVSAAPVAMAAETPTTEQLNDLVVERGSLIAARIIAARRLLGEKSNYEDEELLELANQVHKNAYDKPDNQEAINLSSALYAEECVVWGKQNDADKFGVTTEAVAQAYQQAWSLMLNLPPSPNFKTRKELAEEEITARNLEAPLSFSFTPGIPPPKIGDDEIRMTKEEHIAMYANESEIIQKYYAQFSDYIEQHLNHLCEAKLASQLQAAGLGLFSKDYRFEHVGVVKLVQDAFTSTALNALMPQQGWIIPLPKGQYGFVGSDGSFHKLTKPAYATSSEKLWLNHAVSAILEKHKPGPYIITQTQLKSPLSLKEMLQPRIRASVLGALENWKQEKYDPSTAEVVMRAIVPFYEMAHKLRNDPGYQLAFKDIAWDLFDLGATTASIFASVGVLKAVGMGLKAMKAVQGVSGAARATLGLRTALASIKTSTFLRIAGRELTDFIVPVFTAKTLIKASTQGSAALIRSGLKATLRQMNIAAAKVTDGVSLLDRIYDSLAQARYVPNALAVKTALDERAAREIPPKLFRGQTLRGEQDFLASQWGVVTDATRDDYLAACIRHTSRTGGSAGEVLSLTADSSVAARFASGRENSRVFVIDASAQSGNFRTVEDILKNDGSRLVQKGKISAATLAAAIKHAFNQDESEFFYILGSIPDTLVSMKPAVQNTMQLQRASMLR